MLGGTVVESKGDAEEIMRLSEMRGQQLQVGDEIMLVPCQPEEILSLLRERFGRECPRIDLDPENATPANLAVMALQPHLQALVGPLMAAAYVDASGEERREIANRVAQALQSERLKPLLFPTIEDK